MGNVYREGNARRTHNTTDMSELTDLIINIGETFGWDFLLFIGAIYEIFFPRRLHPQAGTKLQRMLFGVPDAVAIVLELLAENAPNVDENKVHEAFVENGLEKDDFMKTPKNDYMEND